MVSPTGRGLVISLSISEVQGAGTVTRKLFLDPSLLEEGSEGAGTETRKIFQAPSSGRTFQNVLT